MNKSEFGNREMTPQEKEEHRSLQVKVHYCELIQHEIQKLNEDQLFKILVLIKNTIDANETPIHIQHKNKSLFPIELSTKGEIVSSELLAEAEWVKKELVSWGLTGGYGIFSMQGYWSGSSARHISMYVCFCVSHVVDGMIEVRRTYDDEKAGGYTYILTIACVGSDHRKKNSFYDRLSLNTALNDMIEIYNKHE